MSKLSCHIVRDLLPLYCDMVLEPESVKEVEEHLKECQACQEMYEKMNRELSEERRTDNSKEVPEIQKLFKKIKRRNTFIASIIVGVILFLTGTCWKVPANIVDIEDIYISTVKYDHRDLSKVEYVTCFSVDYEGHGVDEMRMKVYQQDQTIQMIGKRSLFSIMKSNGQNSQVGGKSGCPIEDVENIKQVYFNGDLIWDVDVDGAIPVR